MGSSNSIEAAERLARLTDKQREVMALVVQRKTSKQIARVLGISKPAVDQRIASARDALGVETRDEAALIFMSADATYDRITYDPAQLPNTLPTDAILAPDQHAALQGMAAAPSHGLRGAILEKLSGDNRIVLRSILIFVLAITFLALVLIGLSISEVLTRIVTSR